MLVQKRKIYDMSDELDTILVVVDSIIRRIDLVIEPQDYHLLPEIIRELDIV